MEATCVCTQCGSKIKGEWTQSELERMARYRQKYAANSICTIEFERNIDGKLLAIHKNPMCFNWVTMKEFVG
jgi:hypothetical protein